MTDRVRRRKLIEALEGMDNHCLRSRRNRSTSGTHVLRHVANSSGPRSFAESAGTSRAQCASMMASCSALMPRMSLVSMRLNADVARGRRFQLSCSAQDADPNRLPRCAVSRRSSALIQAADASAWPRPVCGNRVECLENPSPAIGALRLPGPRPNRSPIPSSSTNDVSISSWNVGLGERGNRRARSCWARPVRRRTNPSCCRRLQRLAYGRGRTPNRDGEPTLRFPTRLPGASVPCR